MNNPSIVIVLAEDAHQSRLVYQFLVCAGILRHQIRIVASPPAHGSGEQWVRERYVCEVIACRRRSASKGKTALVVVLDSDTQVVQKRLHGLAQSLVDNDQPPIDEKMESVAHLIPKRNVETWILSLNKISVDESQDYKGTRNKADWSNLIPKASQALYELYIQEVRLNPVLIDSLRLGIQELRHTFARRS